MTLAAYQPNHTNELALPAPQQPERYDAVARLADWATSARAAHGIAQSLVETSFVPQQFRGKPAEATAAILAGAEIGLSPMAALKSFDIIQGTAAARAITLRAVVQAQGHEIRVIEQTETRAVVAGRRRGEQDWQKSTWTIDRAQKMGLTGKDNWKKQPGAMLVARATSEVCRLIASDAILGIAYSSEEVTDGFGAPSPVDYAPDPAPAAAPAKRTARRAPLKAAPPPVDEPDFDDEPAAVAEPVSAPPADGGGMSDAMSRKMFACFRDAARIEPALADKDGQLAYIAEIVGRTITSRTELTAAEGGQIIDALLAFAGQNEPPQDGAS